MSPTPVQIRPLQGEVEARYCADFIVKSEPWLTLGLTVDQALQRLQESTREVWVATDHDRIVGVLILFLEGTFKGYIQLLAVHPDFRCSGVGTQLIHFAEDRIFRISPNVFLCVSSFNTHAQRLYRRLGYEKVGDLPDFVVRGHSEFILRKTRGPLREFNPRRRVLPAP